MTTRPSLRHVPWDKVIRALIVAVVLAWSLGFLVGLIVRVWVGV